MIDIGTAGRTGPWRSLLVPLDASDRAKTVVTAARRLLEQEGLSITFLRVVDSPEGRAGDARFRQDSRHWDANDALLAARDQFLRKQDTVCAKLRFGDPATEILRETVEADHDVVLLSSRGAPWRGGPDSGDVAHRVLVSSAAPVLYFHPGAGPAPARFERILVALDGTEEAQEILPAAERMARTLGSVLVLARVVPPDPGRRRAAEDELLRVARDLEARGTACRVLVLEGRPAETVIDVLKEGGIDALALTTHARSGLAEAVFGSVARDLVRSAGVPILMLCHRRRRRPIPESGRRQALRVE